MGPWALMTSLNVDAINIPQLGHSLGMVQNIQYKNIGCKS